MPTRNRHDLFPKTVRKIEEHKGTLDLRFLVLDNSDSQFQGGLPSNVDYLYRDTNINIAQCRNFLIDHCPTEYFIMTDDDVRFSRASSLDRLIQILEQNPDIAQCAPVTFDKLGAKEGFREASLNYKEVCNVLIVFASSKEIFKHFRYDERLVAVEDKDISFQAWKAGFRVAQCYDIIAGTDTGKFRKAGGHPLAGDAKAYFDATVEIFKQKYPGIWFDDDFRAHITKEQLKELGRPPKPNRLLELFG